MAVIEANDPALKSWVSVKEDSDFPIQNLPFGVFEQTGADPRAGIAIGDFVLDLALLHDEGYFGNLALPSGVFRRSALNDFLVLGRMKLRQVRNRVSALLREENKELYSSPIAKAALVPQRDVRMMLPVKAPNYTDFYSSEEHAQNVGSMFRDPANPLLPNWKHLPVAYHGRASSIVVSGTDIRRPRGQIKLPDKEFPEFSATRKLDFELELAFVTCGENQLGEAITVTEAEDYIAGFVLFNDWSARDIQQWEYVPLGPFLGKNFASSISPWLVTLDALEPFRADGPLQDPPALPYLSNTGAANFDIALQASLEYGNEHVILCRSNARYLYWNVRQQLAHHTVNGCNIQAGDLYASGTISGPSPGSFGSLLELSWNGKRPLALPGGEQRTFLEDGDTVVMKGFARNDGVCIGFGECRGKILPAHALK